MQPWAVNNGLESPSYHTTHSEGAHMGLQMKSFFPIVETLSNYKREDLRGDMTAGLTTAVMLIPQGMAYAMLAGLPPIIGLYASTIPVAVYALLGTSRQLAVGPVAMVSLLTATGVGALAETGSADYVSLAIFLALMVGGMQLTMGIARLGFLVNFLSHPVISGFTSAAALIIGFSQLKHLLGVKIERSHHVHKILLQAYNQLGNIHIPTLIIGAASIGILLTLKRVKPTFPAALSVVVLGSLSVWALDLHAAGMAIVGDVPAGLPPFSVPTFSIDTLERLAPTALAISLVGFMESISVAKAFASKNRYEVSPNQELIALGAANIAGGFFHAYPVTGGFSRTAVNAQAGAKSTLASLITAGLIIVTLLFLTPLFYYVPKAVLAAIIMTAVFGLVDVQEVRHLWAVKRSDLALLVLTFAATLSVGIEMGILTGVGASLLWFVVRSTRPHFAVLGRIPGTTAYRNIKNHPEAQTIPGILAIRIDAQFYFGNVTFLKETLKKLERETAGELEAVIIDASSVNQLDSSADAALHELAFDYQDRNIALLFANVKGPVVEVMKRSHFIERLGEDHFFLSVHDAVQSLKTRASNTDYHPSYTTSGEERINA